MPRSSGCHRQGFCGCSLGAFQLWEVLRAGEGCAGWLPPAVPGGWHWLISGRPLHSPEGAAPCPAVPKVPAALGEECPGAGTDTSHPCTSLQAAQTPSRARIAVLWHQPPSPGWIQAGFRQPLGATLLLGSRCHTVAPRAVPSPSPACGVQGRGVRMQSSAASAGMQQVEVAEGSWAQPLDGS